MRDLREFVNVAVYIACQKRTYARAWLGDVLAG